MLRDSIRKLIKKQGSFYAVAFTKDNPLIPIARLIDPQMDCTQNWILRHFTNEKFQEPWLHARDPCPFQFIKSVSQSPQKHAPKNSIWR